MQKDVKKEQIVPKHVYLTDTLQDLLNNYEKHDVLIDRILEKYIDLKFDLEVYKFITTIIGTALVINIIINLT